MTSSVAPRGAGSRVVVALDVLIVAGEEDVLAEAVRASVAAVVGAAVLGAARWSQAVGGEDLARQWAIERDGAPLAGRRVRHLTMSVDGDGVTEHVDAIAWAAIDAVCPTAREEDRLLEAGQTSAAPAPSVPDRYPWSSATHAVDER